MRRQRLCSKLTLTQFRQQCYSGFVQVKGIYTEFSDLYFVSELFLLFPLSLHETLPESQEQLPR